MSVTMPVMKRAKPVVVVEPVADDQPFWATTDGSARIYMGDVMERLRVLPTGSVQTCITSPPYFALRSYLEDGHEDKHREIGTERTPDEYVARMVEVFREVQRVLRDDGTLWLNLGDSYAGGGGFYPNAPSNQNGGSLSSGQDKGSGAKPKGNGSLPGLKGGNLIGIPWRVALALQAEGWILRQDVIWSKPACMPESVKNRCTKSHEYVFMFAKKMGYYFDNEAIKTDAEPNERIISGKSGSYGQALASGRKPSGNGVPGSVLKTGNKANKRSVWSVEDEERMFWWLRDNYPELFGVFLQESVNRGDVWKVAAQGYAGAHFATYPESLITPMILASTSEYGCCADCGAPYRRVTEEKKLVRDRPREYVKRTGEVGTGNSCGNTVAGVEVKTVGWEPTCTCRGVQVEVAAKKLKSLRVAKGVKDDQHGIDAAVRSISGEEWRQWQGAEHGDEDYADTTVEEHAEVERLFDAYDLPAVVPCVVLDPFLGSGTTVACALKYGRHGWGVELSQKYVVDNAIPRTTTRLYDLGMGHLVPDTAERTESVGDEVELG